MGSQLKSGAVRSIEAPSWIDVREVLLLKNYNTRLVVLSTMILGVAAGLVGSFLLLRKRSLMGDALSHACLPGIALVFILMVMVGGGGKNLVGLLLGASITGVMGVGMVMLISKTSRVKDDAAMGIVLSVFFGVGIALLAMIQTVPGASSAGLEKFIYGQAASMVMQDFLLLTGVALVIAIACLFLLKEFTLLCFDQHFGKVLGVPINLLDMVMMALVAAVTVVGMQAVGLILIIAYLITPAATARFWTDDLKTMLKLSSVFGALSGWLGASLSALLPNMPAGAVIVLMAASLFLFSMLFGTSRGIVKRAFSHRQLTIKVGRQHLLRAVFEIIEAHQQSRGHTALSNNPIDFESLLKHRSWSQSNLHALLRRGKREDHIQLFDGSSVSLTESGFGEAARITRNHRLWEIFLITHADIAPSHVDRDADSVEHILSPEMVRELESILEESVDTQVIPPSPHTVVEEVTS
ncbi:MAG: metal ABC transporter permease [Verrucomicrobiae bacterium]|nr:metal ABC transporter permease [Verrucomicrobiae bacterium]NNJ43567.1 iron chelate uptake ABC transporter family permease subunit [Akkermansiaceae bacterium]